MPVEWPRRCSILTRDLTSFTEITSKIAASSRTGSDTQGVRRARRCQTHDATQRERTAGQMQRDASLGSRDRSPLHGEMDGVPGKSESSDVLPPPLPVSSPQPVVEQKSHRDDEGRSTDEAGRDCKRARTQEAAANVQQSASESEHAGGMTEEEATVARQVCDLADVHKQGGDMEAEEHATVHACISL